jgi:hypothetical protein
MNGKCGLDFLEFRPAVNMALVHVVNHKRSIVQCYNVLQRTVCTNPVNTIAIELQMMIMPY